MVYAEMSIMTSKPWISPFLKQCFVTSGVSLNMAASGLVMAFSAGVLEQLRKPDSTIPIDDSSGSWIAALPGLTLFFGNFIAIPIMEKFGRKTANLISIIPLIIGWTVTMFATNIWMLLLARFLHGICMGMSTTIGSLLIGEYTTPKNRGAFLMTISISIAVAVLAAHALGSYTSWKISAFVCTCVAIVDLLIVLCSPESPSWLASQGRYDECRRVFRWLRGSTEEEELEKMIEASTVIRKSKDVNDVSEPFAQRIRNCGVYFIATLKRSEFYKPLIIMAHIYTICQWSGVNIVIAYAVDLLKKVVGEDADVPFLVITLDVQRILSNILAIYFIRKLKRRTLLFVTGGINVVSYLAIAGYSFAKDLHILPYDHPLIGIVLVHSLMFAIATGTLPLAYIIGGEIFPLEFKNLAGGISIMIYSLDMFSSVKTVPFFFNMFTIPGSFCIFAAILCYCLWVSWILLPETKDRTLQDIEEDFRGSG